MFNGLPAVFPDKVQNTELYVQKRIYSTLKFLTLFPVEQNETGLFTNPGNFETHTTAFLSGALVLLGEKPLYRAKAFEQCAGFLRIPQAKNPLDNSAVHPESYHIVEQMASDLNCTVDELIKNKDLRLKIDIKRYTTDTVGLPTLTDIMQELDKPGLDPRKPLSAFRFADVHTLEDLREGMTLPGIVTNITNFGCFVDVGVHQDGLVHISQLADKFVSDPTTVVSLRQQVIVKVLEVDLKRKRLSLTMRG